MCICLNQILMIKKKINSCFETVHIEVADIYSKTSKPLKHKRIYAVGAPGESGEPRLWQL